LFIGTAVTECDYNYNYLGEAVRNLEDVQEFLDSKDYISEATAIA